MALAFVELEKAFDTVPRRMAMATLRWMGAPESGVKMVEAMYENTKHNRCSEEDYVRRRSCDRCRASGRIAWRTGRVE